MANPSEPPMVMDVTSGQWLTPPTTGSTSCMPTSKSKLIAHVRPTSSLHSPTVVMLVSRVTARQRAVNGFDTLSSRASGQLRSMARAIPSVTGMLRSARATPPGPTLSPTGWGSPWASGMVRSWIIAPKPPTE